MNQLFPPWSAMGLVAGIAAMLKFMIMRIARERFDRTRTMRQNECGHLAPDILALQVVEGIMDAAVDAAQSILRFSLAQGFDRAWWFARGRGSQCDGIAVAEEQLEHRESGIHRSAVAARVRRVGGRDNQWGPAG